MQLMSDKPFSQACENNKQAILEQLRVFFADCSHVLEIGSGTGQHAVHFAKGMPNLIWQCSDQVHYHAGINQWIDEFPLENLHRPSEFKVGDTAWPNTGYDGVFSANTAHIMQKSEVQTMMRMISENLPLGGVFCQYGPFTLEGQFNSQSNADFHQKLLSEGYGGYCDLNELKHWAQALKLNECIEMPANNLLLVWHKHK